MPQYISIKPNSIHLYKKADCPSQSFVSSIERVTLPENNRTNLGMSEKAQRRIQHKINWLVFLSKKRAIRYKQSRVINNFNLAFVTLTLPSEQRHTYKELKTLGLNHFLQVLRQKYKVDNYVWKMELQKNGNAHFHLTLDRFIYHTALRKEWNNVLKKMGYIQAYQKRFSNMTYTEYHKLMLSYGIAGTQRIKKMYSKGVKTNWSNPNTIDVKSVKKVKNLAAYLSKYMAKAINNSKENEGKSYDEKGEFGRIWYCSQSISKLKAYTQEVDEEIKRLLRYVQKSSLFKVVYNDYVTSYYFDLYAIPGIFGRYIRECLEWEAIKSNYKLTEYG